MSSCFVILKCYYWLYMNCCCSCPRLLGIWTRACSLLVYYDTKSISLSIRLFAILQRYNNNKIILYCNTRPIIAPLSRDDDKKKNNV